MAILEKIKSERQPPNSAPGPKLAKWLLLLAIVIAGYILINSSLFAVGTVVVEGNNYLSLEDIYRTAGIPEKINIFRLSTSEISSRLSRDLRIAEANVSRRLPATIVISVKERLPMAYAASAYGFVQVDKQGIILAALKNIKQMGVPIITGVKLGNVYIGDKVNVAEMQNAINYLAALDETSLNQLSEVNIKASGEMTAFTLQGVPIRLGGGDRLVEKAQYTRDILRDIGAKKTAIEYIDLHYASPYIKFKQQSQQQQ